MDQNQAQSSSTPTITTVTAQVPKAQNKQEAKPPVKNQTPIAAITLAMLIFLMLVSLVIFVYLKSAH